MTNELSDQLSDTAQKIIAAAQLKVLDRRNPLLVDLPDWVVGFRSHQEVAIRNVLDAYTRVPLVVLDAPTGSGKTLIAETVRRLLRSEGLYVCTTKSLQDQFLHDYSYAKVLKGRANYATEKMASRFHPEVYEGHVSCEDCEKTPSKRACSLCYSIASCPYERAKHLALAANLAVLNTSYWLTEVNNVGRFSGKRFVIADEADTLESSLMGYVSVEIGQRRMDRYKWSPPSKVTVVDSWKEWLDDQIPLVTRERQRLPREPNNIRDRREAKYLDGLAKKLSLVRSGLDDGYWVYTGRDKYVSFKPSRVDGLGNQLLWKHSSRWLLMSATVISAEEMLGSLGYEGAYEVVKVPNTFPIANRKVKIAGVANMGKKAKENGSWEKAGASVSQLVTRHPNDRVLVHTVSYDLSRVVMRHLQETGVSNNRPVLGYTRASERDSVLNQFVSSPRAVLLAPSMDRGIDLPGDSCRVQVIMKVPFPNLGDRQVSQRLYGTGRSGRTWYTVQTVRTIVQMCGRAVRSEDDYAVTYILDTQFRDQLWSQGRMLFPQWWRDSLEWERERSR